MRLYIFIALAILFAAPAAADLYKWVDERGVTHYSDLRPTKLPATARVEPVTNRVSVYSPDKSLLQAVEAARLKKAAPEVPIEHYRSASLMRLPSSSAAAHVRTVRACRLRSRGGRSICLLIHDSFSVRRRPPNRSKRFCRRARSPAPSTATARSRNSASLNNVVPEKIPRPARQAIVVAAPPRAAR